MAHSELRASNSRASGARELRHASHRALHAARRIGSGCTATESASPASIAVPARLRLRPSGHFRVMSGACVLDTDHPDVYFGRP